MQAPERERFEIRKVESCEEKESKVLRSKVVCRLTPEREGEKTF
jgi:hypothetical protein